MSSPAPLDVLQPPPYVLQLADRLRTQDNRATHIPIFAVQQRVRDHGYDTDWGGDSVWIDGANDNVEASEEEAGLLDAREQAGIEVPDGWDKVGYRDRWEFVQPFFTKHAAEAYIEANRHNLTDPRTYVYSGYRNHEWEAVRQLLLRSHVREQPPELPDWLDVVNDDWDTDGSDGLLFVLDDPEPDHAHNREMVEKGGTKSVTVGRGETFVEALRAWALDPKGNVPHPEPDDGL